MKTIKALVEIEIFDDPIYCTSETYPDGDRCPKLGDYDNEDWCYEFLEHVGQEIPFLKCDQCKAAYQKAKQ